MSLVNSQNLNEFEWVSKVHLLGVLTRRRVVMMRNLILGFAFFVIGEQFSFGFGQIRPVKTKSLTRKLTFTIRIIGKVAGCPVRHAQDAKFYCLWLMLMMKLFGQDGASQSIVLF